MKTIFFIGTMLLTAVGFSQETKGARTVEYTVDLDRLKFEKQELGIEKDLSKLDGVQKCEVDALNYKLYVTVFEPEKDNKSIDIDDIKIVLANNGVEIKTYTQKAAYNK